MSGTIQSRQMRATWRSVSAALVVIIISACSDYQAGYQAGYNRQPAANLILFGRADYRQGYRDGRAEVMHADWVAEFPARADDLQCRATLLQAGPLMFTPAGYHREGKDVFTLGQDF